MLNISGLRNQFICMQCYEKSKVKKLDLAPCSLCCGYFCHDLIVYNGEGKIVCFVCQGTALDDDEWPDWAYSLVPEPKEPPLRS